MLGFCRAGRSNITVFFFGSLPFGAKGVRLKLGPEEIDAMQLRKWRGIRKCIFGASGDSGSKNDDKISHQ